MDKTLSKTELWNLFRDFCAQSGLAIESCQANKSCPHFEDMLFTCGPLSLDITLNLRNVSSAYLPRDPSVQRRQVESLHGVDLPLNTKRHLTLLGGFYMKGEQPIFAVWNPFLFCDHKTVRSCYIRKEILDETIKEGYVRSTYASTPVYSCTSKGLMRLLKEYLTENSVD